ncbi:5'(3')-deoxyribonucleotidase [Flavilitoribacter nigricans DSM 23189 = NBRC 102662]|uniref:5'(3')-deoxyribonucleotidase n=2 Tax=Flavilitoribacter TaxID=2762562 RepID=A0A2D0NI05_FLAN2|nr:5'(3')-deoxyribonucleotidase [Flavilitoribacter nigricans DSM 23189 = NBRC 102662]
MKPRIAIDMDEVMADIEPKFQKIYEREFGEKITRDDYWGQKIYETRDETRYIRDFLHDKGFFRDLEVMPDSQEVIRELMEDHEIFITTAAMEFRSSFEDKYDWLQEHFPFLHWKNFVFCGDKSIIRADYMIDDHVRNLESFQGTGLLFTASHNIHEDRFTRVDNWQQVREYFKTQKAK